MAKQAYVYSGTDWVPLASEVTNLSGYQTKALNQFAHRNLVINGDMQIAQRATSVVSITTSSYNTADRWTVYATTLGTWTQSVENDAPTGSGFRKSLKMLCTTADASPATNDSLEITQILEGQNLQQVKKGTAAAEQLTLSFWIKSNVTGTYTVWIYDGDNARAIAAQYTVSASGTWEYKTVTFAADTTGAFDNDNNASLYLRFGLGFGSGWTSGTLASSWQSYTQANVGVGQVNVGAATNNYWQITGVQLEVGPTATPFEFKSVEDELLECQRYYEKTYNQGVNPGTSTSLGIVGAANGTNTTGYCIQTASFKVTKRGTPTVTVYDTAGNSGKITTYVTDGTATTNRTATVDEASQSGFRIYETGTNKNGFFWHYVSDSEL
jgi:phage gp37-like protein